MVGDSDTFPSDVGNANFPDYLSASRSGAAGVAPANKPNRRSFSASMIKLSEDEMRKMNKTSVVLKDGSGYVGYMETIHMLHCVVSQGTPGASTYSHLFLETLVPVVVSRVLHRSCELRKAEHPASW